MSKIQIENLGPIDGLFEMSLDKKLTILIGEQATGKSTIARAIYFSMLSECCVELDLIGEKNNSLRQHAEAVHQYFRKNYEYGTIDYFTNVFSFSFNAENNDLVFSPPGDYIPLKTGGEYPMYIPAGRSVIPLLFESYAAAKNIHVDPFLENYLLFLDAVRKDFTKPFNEVLKRNMELTAVQHTEDVKKVIIHLMESILKGQYRYESGNERLVNSDGVSIPITSASSGQQESLYILISLLFVLCDIKGFTIIIEEPEAHLFPATQKLLMELIAFIINKTYCRFIITTHSPYILTSANLLIHSAKVENKIKDNKVIVEPMKRLKPEDVCAFMLERNGDFSYRSIIDEETGLIDAEEIDAVSETINKGMSDLIDLEVKHDL
ncbi:MAG: AAA family ATPase [Oscillospiraceae bacterium]|jgi:predicted ATPase|nr:AAA family ATPase [Oscillospiraceae bacterium]